MRYFIIVLFVTLLGCGENVGRSYYTAKAEDWQVREAQCPAYTPHERFEPTGDVFKDVLALGLPYKEFRKIGDPNDYWNTSCETLGKGDDYFTGDCDDSAIVWYRIVKDSLPDLDVRIRVYERGKNDHLVTTIYHEGGIVEVDDGRVRDFELDDSIIIEFCEHRFY